MDGAMEKLMAEPYEAALASMRIFQSSLRFL
jgi:hypothetical protein